MPKMLLDYLEHLAGCPTAQEVWELHCTTLEGFGFDRLIYGTCKLRLGAEVGDIDDATFLSNHDPAYFQHFIGEEMFRDATMTTWALENRGAMGWGAQWGRYDDLSEKERKVIEYNRSMDVIAGYTLSLPDVAPRSFCVMSLCARRGLTQQLADEIWAEHGRVIETMCNMAHLKLNTLPLTPALKNDLSTRQREVLEWVGQGKSNQDIATIMGLSVPTVEKHLRLARERLGVETTAQAVLRATFQNQIVFI